MWRLSTSPPRVSVSFNVPNRAYHHGNLRRALLDGAVALFAKRGNFDFTFRELAREAGVTHNAPYRHFAGKSELLAAVRGEGFANLARVAHAALAARATMRAIACARSAKPTRFAIAWPHHFRLMLHNPFEGDAPEQNRGSVHAAARRDRRRPCARRAPQRFTARELALAAWALVHGVSSLIASGQLSEGEAHIKKCMRVLDAVFFDGAAKRTSRKAARRKSVTAAFTPGRRCDRRTVVLLNPGGLLPAAGV